jgi:hypothetical protein
MNQMMMKRMMKLLHRPQKIISNRPNKGVIQFRMSLRKTNEKRTSSNTRIELEFKIIKQ